MTPVLFDAIRDVRTLSAFMIGGLGLIFLVSKVGRNQVPRRGLRVRSSVLALHKAPRPW